MTKNRLVVKILLIGENHLSTDNAENRVGR